MPEIAPPMDNRSTLRRVTVAAFLLAGIFALTTGLSLYAATHRPPPRAAESGRALAGWDASCDNSVQIAVDFATDDALETHANQLRAHLDVLEAYVAHQHDNARRHRMLLSALAAGPDGYDQLVHDANEPATLWLLIAPGIDLGQFADLLRHEAGTAALAVRVDEPCLTVRSVGDEVNRLRDYPTRCLIPVTDPAGQVETPANCPPIP